MLTICHIHNYPEHHCISTDLNRINNHCGDIDCKLVKIVIYNLEDGKCVNGHIYYATDIEIEVIIPDNKSLEIVLYDRDKKRRDSNDRIIILKIKSIMTKMICKFCLDNLIHRFSNSV